MDSLALYVIGWFFSALTLVGFIPAGVNSPVQSIGVTGAIFPSVVGIDLEGTKISLPAGLAGRRNLVAVAFERDQQAVVDTWIEAAQPLLARDADLRLYEVPTISEGSPLFRFSVNNGMRAGITDEEARRRTVTIYVDRERFNAALSIPDTREVHVLLLDADGRIIWRTAGPADGRKFADLARALALGRPGPEMARAGSSWRRSRPCQQPEQRSHTWIRTVNWT